MTVRDDEGSLRPHKREGDKLEHLHLRLENAESSIIALTESHKTVVNTLENLTTSIGRLAEVLEAFNNAKSFWVVIKFISGFAKVMLPIFAFCAAAWLGAMMYLKGRP